MYPNFGGQLSPSQGILADLLSKKGSNQAFFRDKENPASLFMNIFYSIQ